MFSNTGDLMGQHSYEITLDEGNKLVRLVIQGEVSKSEGEEIIIKARAKAAEFNYDILCDITEGSIKATIADWFFLVRNKAIYPSTPTEKTAILISSESWKLYRYVENVNRNVGFKIRVFLKEEDAELTLSVDQNNPLATWAFAVAVPFYSLKEEISLEELKQAWSTGDLILEKQTGEMLSTIWGNPNSAATIVSPEEIVSTLWALQDRADESPMTIIPFERLSPRLKVLKLDGQSPVSVGFDSTNYPLSIGMGLEGSPAAAEEFLSTWQGPQTNRNEQLLTRIAMTGPAGMRRAVADRMERYGLNYPAEETGPVLQAADIAHMSNENAFAPDCPPPDPYDSVNVCNRDEYVQLMVWMGIDVNEMTGNHLNDWGSSSLLHTFDLYESLGIQTYGGGRDLEQAQKPLIFEHNGNRIAFLGCNPVGPPSAWARPDYPGSLACEDYRFLKQQIRELSEAGYLVIVTVQYREDYTYDTAADQRDLFKALAAEGAMAVSGSHGHHPQGFAFLNDSFIHYGLGNLLADQMWSLGSRQSFVDTYLLYEGRLLNVDLWTGLNEDYARVRQMNAQERRDLLETVFAVSEP